MKLLLLVASLIFHLSVGAIEETSVFTLAVPEWDKQANADGSGFYGDILRAVFERNGIEVEFLTVPWKCSILLTQQGKADAFIGSYFTPHSNIIFSRFPIDYEITSVICKIELKERCHLVEHLKDQNVAFVKGYNYDVIFDVRMNKVEVGDTDKALKMLSLGRVEYVIDDYATIFETFERLNFSSSDYHSQIVRQVSVYLGFNDSLRGRFFSEVWNSTFPVAIEGGDIEAIFKQYNYEDYYQLLINEMMKNTVTKPNGE